jgi:Flp pilus assembly protein TadD
MTAMQQIFRSQKIQSIAAAMLLVGIVFLAFGHSLWQDFAPIDDTLLVRENLAIRGMTWENLRYVFSHYDPELYIPLTFVSFQINYFLSGLDPFGFHMGNLLLHAANACLVFAVLRRLLMDDLLAAMGAAIFAVHPLHTEAVVWIAGRKDLLFTFFYLGTVVLYLCSRESTSHRVAWSMGSIFCAALAMLSKATAMTLPVALMLVDWYFCMTNDHSPVAEIRESPLRGSIRILNKIPFLLLAIVCAAIALGGKERVVGTTSIVDTAFVALRSIMHYVWQLFLPMRFSVFYQQRDPIFDAHVVLSLIALTALLGLGWHLRKRRPSILFGFLFYLVTLSPTFFNFHKGLISFFAVDRYAYLPSLGLLIALLGALQSRKTHIILATAIVPLTVFSRMQTRVWDTPESLYRHAVAVDPASVPARATLAQVLRQQGRSMDAFNVLKEGLRYGDDVSYRLEAGNIYALSGQIADAITEFTKASQMKPDLPEPYFSIGSLEDQSGHPDLALEYYQKAVALDPSYVAARSRIAGILIERKQYAEAEEQLSEALQWNESSFIANFTMYRLRIAQGREEEAQQYYDRAKELRPGAHELQL